MLSRPHSALLTVVFGRENTCFDLALLSVLIRIIDSSAMHVTKSKFPFIFKILRALTHCELGVPTLLPR